MCQTLKWCICGSLLFVVAGAVAVAIAVANKRKIYMGTTGSKSDIDDQL